MSYKTLPEANFVRRVAFSLVREKSARDQADDHGA
jgi:hypothetical protein